MLRCHPSRFGWVLVLTLGLGAVAAQAQEFRYHYASFENVDLPPGFTSFFPAAINNSGRVYGTVCDDVCGDPHIASYKDGAVTVSQSVGFANVVNAGGTVGGSVVGIEAGLFRGGEVEPIPPQPGEVFFEFVIALNDPGTALVESFGASFPPPTYVLYSKGQATRLDFGPTVTNPSFISAVGKGKFINNNGIIAGTTGDIFDGARGFRFDPRTGEAALLDPVSPDTLAWGVGINGRGDVLGYSFVLGAPYHERVGVWDRKGHFKTYFDETISSNALVFNDNNLIVITAVYGGSSYLVPKPGVRLDLADLVEDLPSGQTLSYIFDLNNHGDMLGFGDQGAFLLERSGS